jgi:hypothetical protein
MTLREALLESNNAAAVLLQQRVGTRSVLRLARDLGLTEQPDVPSLALGSGLVSPIDLTTAYALFPNMGYRVRPRGIVSVVNANGSTVHQVPIERKKILSEQVGIFVEPASAISVAGLLDRAEAGLIPAGARVVLTVTGHGLKDPQWALKAADGSDVTPTSVSVDVAEIAGVLGLSAT